jgi:hypothetical protein
VACVCNLAAVSAIKPRKTRPLLARDVQVYRLCEDLTEALIYLMAVLSPWAFGTTDDWAMWVMNIGGYVLGALLAIKLTIRRLKGYRPLRWDKEESGESKRGKVIVTLAVLTAAIPVYCLIGALNARSTYHREMLGFEYHDYIKWLPSTFDSSGTWFVSWCSLALACSFWAARDWMLGKSGAEERAERLNLESAMGGAPSLPARWRRLLWVLTINGGLLAVEGIVQRLANCPKLLFMVLPTVHQTADTQFGPYAYRSNAAQYFNLLWPASLGFWWVLQRSGGANRKTRHLPLICASIMAACPIISTTRGGALVAVGMLMVTALFFLASQWREAKHQKYSTAQQGRESPLNALRRNRTGLVMIIFFISSLALGLLLGWKTLQPRMAQITEGYQYRERMYKNAQPMADDYPVYGIGPGAFVYVFQLYRVSTSTYWPPQLHNDWLETRISFGWVGSGLIGLALVLLGLSWFSPGGLASHARFTVMLWIALGGCLIHALFDFPFQIYSVVFLFLIWCAILVNLSRKNCRPQ